LLKNSSFVFCRRFGIAPSQTKKICVEVEAWSKVVNPCIFLWTISSPERKRQCSYCHLDKCWRISGDIKVALDAVHYLKEEKTGVNILHGTFT
jgi:hypothetical protein